MSALSKFTHSEIIQASLWVVAFVGVCALVYVGKLRPETVEMMIMAVIGASSPFGGRGTPNDSKPV